MDTSTSSRYVVVILAAVVFFSGLGSARLWDRDEPRNARCAQEMYERGDWIVPTFNGELRTHKPILLYWMQITAYYIVGANEWGARLPSAICGVLTVLACFGIATRLVGSVAAIWSSIALATSIMFIVASRAATPDAPLILCSTLAIYLFVRAAFRTNETTFAINTNYQRAPEFTMPSLAQWCGIYTACGFAVLAKGPVGFVLPASVIGFFLVWQTWPVADRRTISAPNSLRQFITLLRTIIFQCLLTAWRMRPITATLAVLLVAAPWYAAVGFATSGQWLREFFLTHNVSRAMNTMEGHSGPPLLFYYITLCVGSFPWSIWMLPTTIFLWQSWKTKPGLRTAIVFACCWIGVYVGCFSIAATKLPSYITPCYPAAAMLYGVLLAQWWRGEKILLGWARVGLAISVIVGLGIAIGVGFIRIGGTTPLTMLVPAGFMLLIGAAVASRFMATGQPSLALRAYSVGAIGMATMFAAVGPALVDSSREDLDFIADAAQQSDTRIGFIGEVEPSWIFYANGRADTIRATDWQAAAVEYLQQSPDHQLMLTRNQSLELSQHLELNHSLPESTRSRSLMVARLRETPRTLRNEPVEIVRLTYTSEPRIATRANESRK